MAGVASAIMAGAAVAGAAASAYGAIKKGQGVADNSAANNQVTQDQFNRILAQTQGANDIADWYNGQSKGLADQTQGNSEKTIAGADGGAFTADQQAAQARRAAAGNALVDGAPVARNYSDTVPDSSGTVQTENARKLVDALNFSRAKANSGAAVNSFGDALLGGGLAIQRGNEGQAEINSQQKRTDAIANLRSTLNVQRNQPILSPNAQYDLAAPVGGSTFQNGQLLSTGGNVLGAAAANGGRLIKGADGLFGPLFQGAVPSAAGVMGPQQPGIFNGIFG